jgi:2-iminobutanoate/2-iminopropanoate deaminase
MSRALAAIAAAAAIACPAAAPAQDRPPVEFLNSGKVTPTTLPFSEAVRVGDTLYLSGQIGITPGTLELAPGGIAGEARQTLENIRTTLGTHGYTLRDVVKCTVMLADIAEWAAFNEVYRGFFAPPYPARSALGASGLALGARVEVECIAVKGAPATADSAAARP